MKCLKCGADAPPNLNSSLCPSCLTAQKQKQGRPTGLLIAGFLGLLVVFVVLSSHTTPKLPVVENQSPEINAPPSPSIAEPEVHRSKWDYSAVEMDAGNRTEKVGCIESDNLIELKWPYKDVYADLCFRSDSTVYLHLLGDGQLLSGEGHGAKIRFGEGSAHSFSLEQASDYSSNGAFIKPAGPVFAAAKASKTIIINATYYQAGSQSVAFVPAEPLKLK
jgi:hypothetical protein